MVPVSFSKNAQTKFFHSLLLQGKWGWCDPSCYEEQLLDGFEYCGKQSACVNNDDDTRGMACECSSGYTSHRIFLGGEGEMVVVV